MLMHEKPCLIPILSRSMQAPHINKCIHEASNNMTVVHTPYSFQIIVKLTCDNYNISNLDLFRSRILAISDKGRR